MYRPSNNRGERGLLGFSDEIIVKLKGTTTYEQLQELAEEYNFTIGVEDQFVRNQLMVYVSKTSKFDALRTSNLLSETGLFQFAEPNFHMLGIFGPAIKNASQ
jgi:hypothetical protein